MLFDIIRSYMKEKFLEYKNKKISSLIFNLKEKLSFSNKDNRERKTIGSQKNLYMIGHGEDMMSPYDYRRSELDPAYAIEILNPLIQKTKRVSQNPYILDLGAGKGEEGDYMGSKGVTTIKADISKIGLDKQKNAIQLTSWRLPFKNSSFYGVHSKDMITHIPPEFRSILFSEINRVTKNGGTIILCGAEETQKILNQHETSIHHLVKLIKTEGFVIENKKEWYASKNYKDWYSSRRPRFILELKKPENIH